MAMLRFVTVTKEKGIPLRDRPEFAEANKLVDNLLSDERSTPQKKGYKISLLKPSVKALALSTRVSIRTDNRGFLSLQYMIKNDDGQVCFVEYYCAPDEDVDDPDH